MSRFAWLFVGLFALSVCVGFSGCKPKEQEPAKADADGDDDHKGHDHEKEEAEKKIKENLAKLSEEDRALAEKQGTCVVMEKSQLGVAGVPIKVTVGEDVAFLCCKKCQGKFDEDPDTFMAKLKKVKP